MLDNTNIKTRPVSSVEQGRQLLRVRQMLSRAEFARWLRQAGINARTSRDHMRAALFVAQASCDAVELLPPGLLYRLARGTAPRALVERVLDGRLTDPRAIAAALDEARLQLEVARSKMFQMELALLCDADAMFAAQKKLTFRYDSPCTSVKTWLC